MKYGLYALVFVLGIGVGFLIPYHVSLSKPAEGSIYPTEEIHAADSRPVSDLLDPPIRVIATGRPLFASTDGKEIIVGNFVFLLRSDGLVSWKIPDYIIKEIQRQQRQEQERLLPPPDYKAK